MKQIGILDMEIYLFGNKCFVIIDTKADFNHESAMKKLSKLPRQSEWEALVSKYQKTNSNTSAGENGGLLSEFIRWIKRMKNFQRTGILRN